MHNYAGQDMKWKREEHKNEARQRKEINENKDKENGKGQDEEAVDEGRESKTTSGVIAFVSFPYR